MTLKSPLRLDYRQFIKIDKNKQVSSTVLRQGFPTVKREQVIAFLEAAEAQIVKLVA